MVGQDVQTIGGADQSMGNDAVDLMTRESVVVIDADRSDVRALLFDVVDGVARFVGLGTSSATVLPPYSDASIGLGAALRQLGEQTGRRFVDGDHLITPQHPNGDGVDSLYLTGSPVGPGRAALISPGRNHITRTITQAVRRSQTLLSDMNVDLDVQDVGLSSSAIAAWLRSVAPSTVIFMLDGSPVEERDVVLDAVSDAARDGVIRQGIVVSDEGQQQAVAQTLGQTLELSGIDPSDYGTQEIAIALETEMREHHSDSVQDHDDLRLLSSAAFVERIEAVQAVASFLHRRMGRGVLTLTSGDGTLLCAALRDQQSTVFRADLDLGMGAPVLLRIDPERIARRLPFRWSTEEISDWLLNRGLRPFVELEAHTDLALAAAVRRELLAELMGEADLGTAPEIDLIAAGPAFITEDRALTLLTILDGVAPAPSEGVVTIALDLEGLISPAGALASDDPSFASEVVEQDCLSPLATCVVVIGEGDDGDLATRGELTYASGERYRFSVPYGSLHVLPLPEGKSASLTLTPEPGFSVGSREPGEQVTFSGDAELFGGELGVVIDARGRPVALPSDPELRVARLKSWMQDLGSQSE